MTKRRICIVTGTRAEWGLLSGIARGLKARDDVELQVVATNMHLDPRFGMTINEILDDGVAVDERVEMCAASDSPADTAAAMGTCLSGMARAFDRLRPDLVVILGDRYEMLAVASAATLMRIPIAHIAGGEISEGAIDDAIRHAITKLAALHLTATEEARLRVVSLGEDPEMVINTGAIGVYNIAHEPITSKTELERFLGMKIRNGALLVTLHPATLDDAPVETRVDALLDALDRFHSSQVILTYPNNDAKGRVIIERIVDYGRRNPDRAVVVPSLGRRRYLTALHYVSAVVGNSSSGIVEVPTLHIPTVDIGIRQKGRIAASSVIHCQPDAESIEDAIALALSPAGKKLALDSVNPYWQPDTLRKIVEALATTPLDRLRHKVFVDHPFAPQTALRSDKPTPPRND